jgi:uncharacterized protein YijF (DUF1287 family)
MKMFTPRQAAAKLPPSRLPQACALFLFVVVALVAVASSAQSPGAIAAKREAFTQKLIAAAIERTHHTVRYEPAYVRIPYPNGDVPPDTGVCTDEIIRIYRALGIDLQKEVHEDMQANLSAYPNHSRWLLSHTDTNIDHRRVPNLRVFFERKGERLPITSNAGDYSPGDLVTWDLSSAVPHIGMVVDKKATSGRYMIVHNIGRGPQLEDVLFNWKITGHYRYSGP